MTEDAWNSFLNRIPKDKIITIVELIEEAKKRAGQKSQ